MKKILSPKSQSILDRALLHKARCLRLAFLLGEDSATSFHLKWKSDPGSDAAAAEFNRLIESGKN